jgi:hypothetical protein
VRRSTLLMSLLLSSAVLACAQGYDPLPKLVVHARYVLVTTNAGYDLTSPNMFPDDRQAVIDVQNAIKKWGRYALAYQPKDADLILLVRKGHVAETQPQLRIGGGSTVPWTVGAAAPTDFGSARDMLALYDAKDGGIDSAPLWRDLLMNGLDTPQMPLVGELRSAVDKAAKVP